jgi:hypothetical protein
MQHGHGTCSMDMDMQNGHGHAAWTWTCSGWASWHCFKRFLKTFFSLCHPSRVQAADDGRHGLLLLVYFKRYMTTAVFTSRTMQKRRLHKIFRHLRRYLEALLRFFLRGQNTAATLYIYINIYKHAFVSIGKQKTEAQAIFPNLFTICSLYK